MKKLIVTLVCLLCSSSHVFADGTPLASIFSLQGDASVQRGGRALPASEGMPLEAGDEVVVGDPGRVALAMSDGSYMRLASNSRLTLAAADKKVSLLEGALHFFSHSEQHPTVITEHVTAAIRGTEFSLTTDARTTTIKMMSGSVQGVSSNGIAELGAGEGARFSRGKAPEVYALMQSERTVQWSAFVPLFAPEEFTGNTDARALRLLSEGKSDAALALLPRQETRCTMAGALRGRVLVSRGDVAVGTRELERCVASGIDSGVIAAAASTLSAVKLAQGQGDESRALAQTAVALAPSSVSSRLVLSFALQDKGDLDGALAAVTSDMVASEDLTARRAELLFMFGRVPEARELLETLRDRSWYAETVYGWDSVWWRLIVETLRRAVLDLRELRFLNHHARSIGVIWRRAISRRIPTIQPSRNMPALLSSIQMTLLRTSTEALCGLLRISQLKRSVISRPRGTSPINEMCIALHSSSMRTALPRALR